MLRDLATPCAALLTALFTLASPAAAGDEQPVSAPEAAPAARSLYAGWRLFQQQCARCHGSDAAGLAGAPDLLARVRGMSEGRFVATVLKRYQWTVPAAAGSEGAARDALIEDVLQRRVGGLQMPAWDEEPAVQVHVGDLYRFLDARAAGTLGPGRPPRPQP